MSPSDPTDAAGLAKEIERLANQYFAGVPGPALNMAGPAAAPPAVGAPAPLAPPNVGPNAMNVGAGGASPSVGLPPIPGAMHRPPIAAAPPPKESDLRAIPTLLSENLGTPSAIALASAPPADPQAPYFLELAGLPSTGNVPAPTSPGAVPEWPEAFTIPLTSQDAPVAPGPTLPAAAPAAPAPRATSYEFQPEVVPDLRSTSGAFDPNVVKRDFPILQERVHGRPLVWLDNAATTQKPQAVIDRLSYFYEHENSNVHRAAHTLAARATDAYEAAREKVSRFLNAPSSKEIVWVRGTTEAINLVAQSWGRRNVGPGDEIVITWLEHHANIVPWQQLASEKGARLRVAPVDDRGQVILEEYERLLGPRTRIVSFAHVSNALGTITPAREMVAMAHRYGARVLVDGAQAVSHMPVDVQALDCDFYCFSGHKVFGPTGIGALFGKTDVLETMPPWQGGGNMIADVTFEKTVYQPPPGRFEAGTGNIADAVGLGAALDYLSALGLENVSRYEHELLVYATEQLARVPGLTMVGTAPEKAGVLSFVLDGIRTEDVGGALNQEGIAVRSGHHCAQPILRRFGLESSVRASLAVYNTCEDVDALVAALLRLQSGRHVHRI
ncbi:MAG TPA: family 2A encapsulin nanocompartment cargo protein cysteine desulfurase [Polyangiaceae bacterium]|jgi:cysteine desulfurase/selenocysteine lyase|nr:family 2A encapsulin nanocompartment cargo protein cysteine desulfurase [Polyangiaceae bacterium]